MKKSVERKRAVRELERKVADQGKALDAKDAEIERLEKDCVLMQDHMRMQEAFHAGEAERGRRERARAAARLRRERLESAKWRHTAIAGAVLMAIAVAIMALATFATPVSAEGNMDVSPETDENALIEEALLARAHVIEDCRVTHYCTCVRCCGKDDGITATGVQASPYVTVAVDPSVIPLGSDVLVDYGDGDIQYYRADDTGVKGNAIDLCVASHDEALQLGVRYATVYWVEQEAE